MIQRPILNRFLPGAILLAGLAATARAAFAQDTIPSHEAFTITAKAIGEVRLINVYTPPGYGTAHRAYPVMYMLDGGLAEDFPHIVNTLDSLIRLRKIRPLLVVGIENTQRRRDLTGPTTVGSDSTIAPRVGGSGPFRAFIRDQLMPEVRKRYRCTGETGLVGESLAGLFTVETFILEPTLFQRYFALSPSLFWNNKVLVRTAEARLAVFPKVTRTLFLTAANEPGIEAETAELAAILKTHAPSGLTWEYVPRPDLRHDTIFRAMIPGAFAKYLR